MKRRLIRTGSIAGICIVVIVPLYIALSHWMESSSAGTVTVGAPAKQAQVSIPHDPLTVATPYFTTMLPTGFTIKRQADTPTGNPTLLQLVALAPSTIDEQFATTIGIMPGDGLDGIAGYHTRSITTATYARTTLSGLPSGAVAFKTIDGPLSYVAYVPHGNRYAEIAVSTEGVATPEKLQALFAQAIKEWTWK